MARGLRKPEFDVRCVRGQPDKGKGKARSTHQPSFELCVVMLDVPLPLPLPTHLIP